MGAASEVSALSSVLVVSVPLLPLTMGDSLFRASAGVLSKLIGQVGASSTGGSLSTDWLLVSLVFLVSLAVASVSPAPFSWLVVVSSCSVVLSSSSTDSPSLCLVDAVVGLVLGFVPTAQQAHSELSFESESSAGVENKISPLIVKERMFFFSQLPAKAGRSFVLFFSVVTTEMYFTAITDWSSAALGSKCASSRSLFVLAYDMMSETSSDDTSSPKSLGLILAQMEVHLFCGFRLEPFSSSRENETRFLPTFESSSVAFLSRASEGADCRDFSSSTGTLEPAELKLMDVEVKAGKIHPVPSSSSPDVVVLGPVGSAFSSAAGTLELFDPRLIDVEVKAGKIGPASSSTSSVELVSSGSSLFSSNFKLMEVEVKAGKICPASSSSSSEVLHSVSCAWGSTSLVCSSSSVVLSLSLLLSVTEDSSLSSCLPSCSISISPKRLVSMSNNFLLLFPLCAASNRIRRPNLAMSSRISSSTSPAILFSFLRISGGGEKNVASIVSLASSLSLRLFPSWSLSSRVVSAREASHGAALP